MGGYRYIHHAIDDYSRVVYSEILDDERKDTAAGFIQRANTFFKDLGVTVQAVMTDNGACYRTRAFNQVLSAAGVKHRYTRPYRPQTGLLGVFRTVLVLCFRLPSLSSGARVLLRSGCGIPGLSEGGHDCILARSMRQYP